MSMLPLTNTELEVLARKIMQEKEKSSILERNKLLLIANNMNMLNRKC